MLADKWLSVLLVHYGTAVTFTSRVIPSAQESTAVEVTIPERDEDWMHRQNIVEIEWQ